MDPQETREWVESLDATVALDGTARAKGLLERVLLRARRLGADPVLPVGTDYVNTIRTEDEPKFPGDEWMEKRIRRMVRWNAACIVTRANKNYAGIGGHISTFASSASIYDVAFNHFFRGKDAEGASGDQIYFQGHAAPGIYARAFLEGRISEAQLDHFRREIGRASCRERV